MPILKLIEPLGKRYYGPLKSNRQVSLGPEQGYHRVDSLRWSDEEAACGKLIHLNVYFKSKFNIQITRALIDSLL